MQNTGSREIILGLMGYFLGTLFTFLALATNWQLHLSTEKFYFFIFYPVIFLVALIYGFRPGVYCTLLAGLLANAFLIPPYELLSSRPMTVNFATAIFITLGMAMSWVAERAKVRSQQLALSENHLKTIIENMEEGLILADASGRVVDLNPAACRLTGFKGPENFRETLEDWPDAIEMRDLSGRQLDHSERPISRVLRGEKFTNYELQVRRQDNGREWLASYSGSPVYDHNGIISKVVVTVRPLKRPT